MAPRAIGNSQDGAGGRGAAGLVVFVRVTPDFAIGPQVAAGDFAALRAAGFAGVINARPDGESGDHPRSAEAAALARAAGLAYAHCPTDNHAVFEPEVVDAFEEAMASLPAPIFAHCKSGTRAAILWAQVAARYLEVEQVIALLRAAGQELEFLEQELRDSAQARRGSPFQLKADALLGMGRSRLMPAESGEA